MRITSLFLEMISHYSFQCFGTVPSYCLHYRRFFLYGLGRYIRWECALRCIWSDMHNTLVVFLQLVPTHLKIRLPTNYLLTSHMYKHLIIYKQMSFGSFKNVTYKLGIYESYNMYKNTYSSYVMIRDVAQKTCQRRWTIGKSGERGFGISVLAARHDDDDWSQTSIEKKNINLLLVLLIEMIIIIIIKNFSHSIHFWLVGCCVLRRINTFWVI